MSLALPSCQNCKSGTLNFADCRRHRHADSLEHLAAYAFCPAANRKFVAVFLYVGLLQCLQILFYMRPLKHVPGVGFLFKRTFII